MPIKQNNSAVHKFFSSDPVLLSLSNVGIVEREVFNCPAILLEKYLAAFPVSISPDTPKAVFTEKHYSKILFF